MNTLGSINIQNNRLIIDCLPHVAIKLRRLFEGAQRKAAGRFELSATPERVYDLAWFSTRYRLDVDPTCVDQFERLRQTHERRLDAISRVLGKDNGYDPPPFDLAIPPRDYQRLGADLAIKSGALLIGDDLGTGKQHPIDTLVATPLGFTPIGLLRVGDRVIGSDGRPTEVIGVFPQGVKPSYRVRFGDGSSVEAGPDHLWSMDYYAGGKRLQRIVVTTEQLRTGAKIPLAWNNGRNTSLDLSRTSLYLPMLSGPIEYEDPAVLPMRPYTLGALIANGSTVGSSATLTTHAKDWAEVAARIRAEGEQIGKEWRRGNVARASVIGGIADVRALGVDVPSGRKFIPSIYQRAAAADRIALLQGLMDGDGSISQTGNRIIYSSTSRLLAEGVRDLVEGLGGVASIREYDRTASGRPVEFTVRVRLPPAIAPFSTRRKLSRYAPSQRENPTRSLVGVDYVREVESVCIAVAAPDRLYATEHCILTHNTITAICTLVAADALPALVVTLTHLTRQWQRELAKFTPKLRTHVIKSMEPYELHESEIIVDAKTKRRRVVRGNAMPDVIITNYHKLNGWADHLGGRVKTVIFDEAQELRIAKTKKHDAAKSISGGANRRVGLSATPVYNYGAEIHSVVDVISPGALGERKEFLAEWCGETGGDDRKAKVRDPIALGTYLRESGIMIRRTRKDVGRELPALSVIRHEVEADASRLAQAAADVRELAQRVLARIGDRLERMRNAGDLDWRLRQLTGISKAAAVVDFVRILAADGERILLFGWHHEVYAVWADRLKQHGVTCALFTGQESEAQKATNIEMFKTGQVQVLIMSLRSGAGIDGLQACCRTVVFGELDWSPKVHDQCVGRAHRDGQTEPVSAYYLVATEGSDPVIADVLGLKEAQSEGIMNPATANQPRELDGADDDRVRRLAEDFLRRHQAA